MCIFITRHIHLSNIDYDVTTSKIQFCHICQDSVLSGQFSKIISESEMLIQVETKVHFKILQLLVETLNIGV